MGEAIFEVVVEGEGVGYGGVNRNDHQHNLRNDLKQLRL